MPKSAQTHSVWIFTHVECLVVSSTHAKCCYSKDVCRLQCIVQICISHLAPFMAWIRSEQHHPICRNFAQLLSWLASAQCLHLGLISVNSTKYNVWPMWFLSQEMSSCLGPRCSDKWCVHNLIELRIGVFSTSEPMHNSTQGYPVHNCHNSLGRYQSADVIASVQVKGEPHT